MTAEDYALKTVQSEESRLPIKEILFSRENANFRSMKSFSSLSNSVRRQSATSRSIIDECVKCCTDCGRRSRRKTMITRKYRGNCDNEGCDAFLCKSCKNRWVLLVSPERSDEERVGVWKNGEFKRFCKSCYMDLANIDFNSYSEVVEPKNSFQHSNTTIIFGHREGWCRASFRAHAKFLAENHGHVSILMDYPGHGSRWREECSVENCINAISNVLKAYNIPKARDAEASGKKTIFVSSSIGGIVACHAMRELKDYFSGIILDSCCSSVPWRENIMHKSFSFFMKFLTQYNRLRLLRAIWILKGSSYVYITTGYFGAAAVGENDPMTNINCLDHLDLIAEFEIPTLILNGTNKEHSRNIEKNLQDVMELFKTKTESKVVLFEGGNHMISHDRRFFRAWVEVAASFIYHL